ncbi:MAG: hypothetical protein MR794_06975 [Bacteroidales bacterium]|nr:hypothetical protein [Bacteroidales bacterium]
MDKKTLYHIVEWAVALAACTFLGYKLVTFEDYPALWESLRSMAWQQYLALGLCVALMPVNMAIEAWRWRTLWNGDATLNGANGEANELTDERLTFKEAHRQVYYSKLAGVITPWRLGEYPARGVLITNERMNELGSERIWPRVLAMGAVGSATMTFAIVLAGVPAIMANGEWLMVNGEWWIAVGVILLLLVVGLALAPRLLRQYAEVSYGLIIKSVGQSLVRLICWCVQLALVLWALEAFSFQPSVISSLFIYYLLVTITPNVPIAEVGVRGAWAIVVFGSVNAAFAGVLLWVINTLLPCLGWFFFRKK